MEYMWKAENLYYRPGEKITLHVGKTEYRDYRVVECYPHYIRVTNGLYDFCVTKTEVYLNLIVSAKFQEK